jgi:hypothetical protein
MGIKKRHSGIVELGASGVGQTKAADMGSFTKGIVYIEGSSFTVKPQGSSDGSTWHNLRSADGSAISWVGLSDEAYQLEQMPSNFRVNVTVGSIANSWVEGIREIA